MPREKTHERNAGCILNPIQKLENKQLVPYVDVRTYTLCEARVNDRNWSEEESPFRMHPTHHEGPQFLSVTDVDVTYEVLLTDMPEDVRQTGQTYDVLTPRSIRTIQNTQLLHFVSERVPTLKKIQHFALSRTGLQKYALRAPSLL